MKDSPNWVRNGLDWVRNVWAGKKGLDWAKENLHWMIEMAS